MDSDQSPTPISPDGNFGFAFNDSNFSDRLLRIEIVAGLLDSQPYGEGLSSVADWARHRKRRREDIIKKEIGQSVAIFSMLFFELGFLVNSVSPHTQKRFEKLEMDLGQDCCLVPEIQEK